MKIVDIRFFEIPKQYLALQDETGSIYELPMFLAFDELFKLDPALETYYNSKFSNIKELYFDLDSLDYPLAEKMVEIVSLFLRKDQVRPIPKDIYPCVLRAYRGQADEQDLFIIDLHFGRSGTMGNSLF